LVHSVASVLSRPGLWKSDGFAVGRVHGQLDLEGRSYARINRLLEAFLAQMKADPSTPLAWLLRQRSRSADSGRFDADFGEDVGVSDERLDAVRVMTIHKAKGLEARYVIVYGWSSVLHETETPPGQRGTIVIRTDSFAPSSVEFSLPWGPVVLWSDRLQAAVKEEETKSRAEAVRLAYVATTRARDQLTFLCTVSRSLKLPERFSLCWRKNHVPAAKRVHWTHYCECVRIRPPRHMSIMPLRR
jgi:ATP-dependent exoDNAse (exonuclease V) beta subunit